MNDPALRAELDALCREAGKLEITEWKQDAIYTVALNLLVLNKELEKRLEEMDLVVVGWVTGMHPAMEEAKRIYTASVERNKVRQTQKVNP